MTKAILIFSILLGSVFSLQALAVTIQGDWKFEASASLSKNDIKMILERVGDTEVNGRKFDLQQVQNYFIDIDDTDYAKLSKQKTKYKKDYGTGHLADLLLYIAMGEYSIKEQEKRYKMTIPPAQQVEYDHYRFNDDYRSDGKRVSVDRDFGNACIVAFSEGDINSHCDYHEGSSGLFGLSLYIFSGGYFGTRNGRSAEYTSCVSSKSLNVLIRTVNSQGQEVLTERPEYARGESYAYNEHVWFPVQLKKESRNFANNQYGLFESRLLQYTCDRYQPTGKVRAQALEKITDRVPQDLDNDDVIDSVLVPVVKDNARLEVPASDPSPINVIGPDHPLSTSR